MPLRASIDLGNEYFRVEHISDAKDVKTALAGFSAGKRAAGLELYLKKSALTDEAECDARTYLVRDVVTDEIAVYFSLRTCLVPFQFGDGSMYTISGIELSKLRENAWVFQVGRTRSEFHLQAYQAEIRSGLCIHVSKNLTTVKL